MRNQTTSLSTARTGTGEFVALMAVLMSLMALTIDAMLPALGEIGTSLGVENANDNQLIISTIFIGMAMGLMFYGPLSDSYGRKKATYLGVSIYLVGCVVSLVSTNFTIMLAGRILQGFGGAAFRVTTLAMIRDKFEGREMGKIMSLIMIVFILVPALAPSAGQAILIFSNWRSIFALFIVLGIIAVLWLHFRRPETLPPENRIRFSLSTILAGSMETLRHPTTRGYTIASGMLFGAFVGYLSSSQQILQIQYNLGDLFSVYFGCLALAIGFASFANSRLVMSYKMETLCLISLSVLTASAALFIVYAHHAAGHPALFALMAYLGITFFCFGILFGNFNALAVQPLGHIAGVANSVISSVQTLLSVILGGAIGQLYDGTVLPLVLGFLVLGLASLLLIFHTIRSTRTPSIAAATSRE